MKKSIKIIVPLILALLIIASILWYGFVYDRDFTRDILLKQARLYSTNGNQELASWFYDLAYNQSGQDENVAIELANQFKAAGNYTKAEFTLSHAIADGGGTVELYIALCKTYVEQDKLLDAVNMLNNVANPEIKAALDNMRPTAPTSDPAPGFYSQYIPVTLNCDGGTLYYTTNKEYPSIDDIPYSEPFTLPAGETTVYAVTVADNGLVSPLSVLGFTVGGVIEEVAFEDSAIEQAVRTLLGVDADEALYTNQLWTITSFSVPEDATVFSDLSKFSYLESLTMTGKKVDSLQFLSSMTSLRNLDLSGSRFSANEIGVIASLPSLQYLNLSNCGLSTIAGLENSGSLVTLNLANNTIRNLDPLSGVATLNSIDLQHNAVIALDALSGLPNLTTLDVSYNALSSISVISGCPQLSWLNASNNSITNVNSIDKLKNLTYLNVSHNALTDVSVLAANTALTELSIATNSLTDISALSTLVNLETFDFAYNQIASLPAWPNGSALRTIDGSYNVLTSIDSLKNMESLSHVYMDYNQITSVAALESCYNLVMVNIYGNAVTGVEKLTAHDIIVNYDPTAAN